MFYPKLGYVYCPAFGLYVMIVLTAAPEESVGFAAIKMFSGIILLYNIALLTETVLLS